MRTIRCSWGREKDDVSRQQQFAMPMYPGMQMMGQMQMGYQQMAYPSSMFACFRVFLYFFCSILFLLFTTLCLSC
jgi:hypothetical protein